MSAWSGLTAWWGLAGVYLVIAMLLYGKIKLLGAATEAPFAFWSRVPWGRGALIVIAFWPVLLNIVAAALAGTEGRRAFVRRVSQLAWYVGFYWLALAAVLIVDQLVGGRYAHFVPAMRLRTAADHLWSLAWIGRLAFVLLATVPWTFRSAVRSVTGAGAAR